MSRTTELLDTIEETAERNDCDLNTAWDATNEVANANIDAFQSTYNAVETEEIQDAADNLRQALEE